VADLPNRTTARPLPTFGGVEPVIPSRTAPGGPGSAEFDRRGMVEVGRLELRPSSQSAACPRSYPDVDLRFVVTRRDRRCPLLSPSRRSSGYPACTVGSLPSGDGWLLPLRSSRPGTGSASRARQRRSRPRRRPHAYQVCSGDAFKLRERETASSSVWCP
jgi:hypothetical protein